MTSPLEPPMQTTPPTAPAASPFEPAFGAQPPPPPPGALSGPPKGRKWWKVLLVVLAVLVVGIAGCVTVLVRVVSAPVGVANDFLGAMNAQDFAGAEEFVGECSGGMNAADFEQFRGSTLTYNLNSSSIANGQATVAGNFMIDGVRSPEIRVWLAKEDGDWKVCGFRAGEFSADE